MTEQTERARRVIQVNGEPKRVTAGTLGELLEELGQMPNRGGIAVARNGAVVPRGCWDETVLVDGDAVEIVGAVQGG